MELYEPSLSYHVSIYEGQKYIEFEHGSFLGLQVLGEDVEPCFEGASFFSLQQSIQDTIQKIKEYTMGGQSEMPNINFKLSDEKKCHALWEQLNPNYTEEGNWTCDCSICEVFDEYAIVFNYENNNYERVYYVKNDETDCVEIGERVPVYMVDVTETEKKALDMLQALNGGTYDLVNENLVNAEANATQVTELGAKIEEMNESLATLNTEMENAQAKYAEAETKIADVEAQYTEAQAQIAELTEAKESLEAYKKAVENQQKEAVVAEYADKLSEEVLETYKAKFDEYTTEDLDMHLAYELKKTGAAVYEKAPTLGRLPKETPLSGVEAILANYKR